jgi:hypothetical protein
MSNPFQPLGVISLHERENTPKSDSLAALDTLDGSTTSGGASTSPTPVIIQPHVTGEGALARLYAFAVHTSSRTWHLAAESAKERDEWVRVLCACGGQLSASSAEAPRGPSHLLPPPVAPPTAPPADGTAAPVDGADGSGALQGLLWKRASKVHIAQRSEAETGQGRDWVARHFALLPNDHSIIYKQVLRPLRTPQRVPCRAAAPSPAFCHPLDAPLLTRVCSRAVPPECDRPTLDRAWRGAARELRASRARAFAT